MAPFMKMNHLFSPGRRFFLRFFRGAARPSASLIPLRHNGASGKSRGLCPAWKPLPHNALIYIDYFQTGIVVRQASSKGCPTHPPPPDKPVKNEAAGLTDSVKFAKSLPPR
ncbi:hypothetical protein [Labrys miyagiensis]|uniref:hypothetical protein n=1 Tax=Labrys miyagiensis TaxID=346912 RepID=UPI0024E12A9C|nr:hypothetical protein [Labrys miyagiensis]